MNNFNELDDKKLGYTQCFRIIKGKMIPINLYAKMIIEPEQNSSYYIKLDDIEPKQNPTYNINFDDTEPKQNPTYYIKLDDID
nr:hypothetical protein [Megavirus caiporensis]